MADHCPRADDGSPAAQAAVQNWMVTQYRPKDLDDPASEAKLWSGVPGLSDVLAQMEAARGIAYEDMAAVIAVILNKSETNRTTATIHLFEWTRDAVLHNINRVRNLIPAEFTNIAAILSIHLEK